jgi:hypothetical protein
MKRCIGALLLWMATGAALAGAPALTAADVLEFMDGFDAAERVGDVGAISAALAPDCRVEMRSSTDGHEHVTAMSHDEYLHDLDDYYGSLHDVAGYEYRSEPAQASIAADGASARATRQVTESFSLDGERHTFHVEEIATLVRRDGRLLITALASRSRPD